MMGNVLSVILTWMNFLKVKPKHLAAVQLGHPVYVSRWGIMI